MSRRNGRNGLHTRSGGIDAASWLKARAGAGGVPSRTPGKSDRGNPESGGGPRSAVEAFTAATAASVERWKKNLQSGVPEARFVDLPGAGHYVFLSREAEVLRGLQ